MIEEVAQVVSVDGDDVWVQTQRQSACSGCSVKNGCGTSVLASVVGRKFSVLKLKNTHDAVLGDQLLIGIDESMLVQGSVLAYLLPLMGLFVFGLLASWAGNHVGIDGELHIITSALAGLVLGFYLLRRIFNRHQQHPRFQPTIIRKVQHLVAEHDTMLLP